MFFWYRDAVVCYTYLADVAYNGHPSAASPSGHLERIERDIRRSRWFTRGWTLQELLVPRRLEFYSQDWKLLGSRKQFADAISSMTRTGRPFLLGRDLELASIAQKMSWAATRRITRAGDVAYCLLGIFDVNMPLIYGEGAKAFQRLQETLCTTYPMDPSLFAWGKIVDTTTTGATADEFFRTKVLPWKPDQEYSRLRGLLARSPLDFFDSHSIQHRGVSLHRRELLPLAAPPGRFPGLCRERNRPARVSAAPGCKEPGPA